jgi:pathogenesis-related protein 1
MADIPEPIVGTGGMRMAARLVATLAASLLLLLALAAVGAVAVNGRAAPGAEGFTPAQADEAVRAHNAWRQRAAVTPLRWAADLAASAQARAADLATHGCAIAHGPLPDNVGENLYHAGPLQGEGLKDALAPVTATGVVDAWGAESADYSRANDTCAPNRQCAHYTQIVWATTEAVGCGASTCPTLGQVWVCRYRPKGNVR